jgi:hypothetical protein
MKRQRVERVCLNREPPERSQLSREAPGAICDPLGCGGCGVPSLERPIRLEVSILFPAAPRDPASCPVQARRPPRPVENEVRCRARDPALRDGLHGDRPQDRAVNRPDGLWWRARGGDVVPCVPLLLGEWPFTRIM